MKKILTIMATFLLIIIVGFIVPSIIKTDVPDEYAYHARATQEPIGFLFPGITYNDSKIENTCRPSTPVQTIVRLQTWMFIPGPLVQICTMENDPLEVGGAGVVHK